MTISDMMDKLELQTQFSDEEWGQLAAFCLNQSSCNVNTWEAFKLELDQINFEEFQERFADGDYEETYG